MGTRPAYVKAYVGGKNYWRLGGWMIEPPQRMGDHAGQCIKDAAALGQKTKAVMRQKCRQEKQIEGNAGHGI